MLAAVQVLVGGRDDQDVFMVMEFLEHDLKGLLEQGRLKDFGPSDVSVLGLHAGDDLLQTRYTAAGSEVPQTASAMSSPEPLAASFVLSRLWQRALQSTSRACHGVLLCGSAGRGSAREVCHHCLAQWLGQLCCQQHV